MYAPDWPRLARKISKYSPIPRDIDWESLGMNEEFARCILERLSGEGDIRECLELTEGWSILPGGPPEGPPPRRDYYGGKDPFPDCVPRILIDIRPMVSTGWSKWNLRDYLKFYLFKCENVVKSITLAGSASDMHTLGLTGAKGMGPTQYFNAFVEGINTTRSRDIGFRLLIADDTDDGRGGRSICLI